MPKFSKNLQKAAVVTDHNDTSPAKVKVLTQQMNRPFKRPSKVPGMVQKFHGLGKK